MAVQVPHISIHTKRESLAHINRVENVPVVSDCSAAQKHGSEECKGEGSKVPTGQGEAKPLQSLSKVIGSGDIVEHATFNLKVIGEIQSDSSVKRCK